MFPWESGGDREARRAAGKTRVGGPAGPEHVVPAVFLDQPLCFSASWWGGGASLGKDGLSSSAA